MYLDPQVVTGVDLTDEDDGEEDGVGVDHAGALLPGTAAAEESDHKDDHTCK